MNVHPLSLGVAIPTNRRPDDLARCLQALARQERLPDDVIVTVRDADEPSRRFLAGCSGLPFPLRVLEMAAPGLVAGRNAALEACRTEILAFLDDDTAPHPDWARRVADHFEADPTLGGLGGKDRLHDGTRFNEGRADRVGQVQWFGRVIADHHLGHGGPRPVDMLKGANMSFRAAAFADVRFDTRLRGSGAQPNEDLAFSLAVRRAHWALRYDPAVVVDHFSGSREEVRHYVAVAAVHDVQGFRDWAFNEVVALWDELPPWRRGVFAAWSLLVGTRVCPGLVQAVRFTPRLGFASWQRFLLAQRGKLDALRVLMPSRGAG